MDILWIQTSLAHSRRQGDKIIIEVFELLFIAT